MLDPRVTVDSSGGARIMQCGCGRHQPDFMRLSAIEEVLIVSVASFFQLNREAMSTLIKLL
ncbi:hypothetical protein CKO25_18810 [Thiocapsa imhoffii]|uniref:Uncharacterized protein n=1 Tax=Thiocapsa imhoffii TaxID=382777 RepID=A0A9X1BA67_9GAMM|nr:hypothetical protein [Thiocapsa imhoffii]